MEILDQKIRVAKKNHKCCFCGMEIAIGEKYEWQKNIFEGQLYEWKNHISCGEIASKLGMYKNDDGDGITKEDFVEYINEEYNLLTDPEGKILPPFKDRLLKVKQIYGIK